MELKNIKPKEATAIINSLLGGVVPKIGVQHITVGRSAEVAAIVQALEEVKNGHSLVKFWIGDYGSGKSFMLHLLNLVAMKQKFVVASADFTPSNRIYANDGKSLLLYAAIMDNIAIQTKPEGGALATLLEKWIEQVVVQTAEKYNLSPLEIRKAEHLPLIEQAIQATINEITEVGGFDFARVLLRYYEGYSSGNDSLRRAALRWLKGEFRTKTEARQELGVREIINDDNYYDMLKNWCKLFVSIGYSGFMINFDEAVNLYKISNTPMREKNYEKIMTLYNDCFQGKIGNLFLNFAGTKEFLENPRRGLFSYDALKSRLQSNKYESLEIRDFSQPVIRLQPLSHSEIFALLHQLKEIFDFNYQCQSDFNDADIKNFMEEMFNKPGARDFLTPREVIRDFLNLLSILRQNPQLDKRQLIGDIVISDERPDSPTAALFDSIEEL
jgi:hypothetical protein